MVADGSTSDSTTNTSIAMMVLATGTVIAPDGRRFAYGDRIVLSAFGAGFTDVTYTNTAT